MATKVQTDVNTGIQLSRPKMYAVLLHNDDYTPMDFVVDILIQIFHKSSVEASSLMLEVHNSGKSTVGIYTYDIAVTKKIQTDQKSNEKGYPLMVTVEEAVEA